MLRAVEVNIGIKASILDLDHVVDSGRKELLLERIKVFFQAVQVELDLVEPCVFAYSSILRSKSIGLELALDDNFFGVDVGLVEESAQLISKYANFWCIIFVGYLNLRNIHESSVHLSNFFINIIENSLELGFSVHSDVIVVKLGDTLLDFLGLEHRLDQFLESFSFVTEASSGAMFRLLS